MFASHENSIHTRARIHVHFQTYRLILDVRTNNKPCAIRVVNVCVCVCECVYRTRIIAVYLNSEAKKVFVLNEHPRERYACVYYTYINEPGWLNGNSKSHDIIVGFFSSSVSTF